MEIMIKLACTIFISSVSFLIKISKDSSAKHYQNNKVRLQKKLEKDIKVFLKKKKKRKRQYDRERYKNLSEDQKQNLVEYRKKYYKMRKKALL